MTEDKRTGSCQCGAVRYESLGAAAALYACHCAECRKQSASAFGMSLQVPRDGLRLTEGTVKYWTRTADSGRAVNCAFCGTCESRLWHEREGGEDTVTIKAGSLDQPVDFSEAIHIWTARCFPGIIIPQSARQFPGEPD